MAKVFQKEPVETETFDSSDPLLFAIIGMRNLMRHLIRHGAKSDWAEIRYEMWRLWGPKLNKDKCQIPVFNRTTEREGGRFTARIAVVVHVHFPGLWPELRTYLDNIPVPFDLYVSLTDTLGVNAEEQIRQAFPKATIRVIPNRGRDILGFQKFADIVLDPSSYDLVCKVHSKSSVHLANGDKWRRDLLDGVLGNSDRVLEIISRFNRSPEVGMIASSSCFASFSVHTQDVGLRGKVDQLASRLDITRTSDDFVFVAGTMFWARVTALAELRNLNLRDEDFEMESGQSDGLLSHAYERFLGLQVFRKGFHYSAISTYRVRPFWLSRSYRYLQGFPFKNA